MRLTLTQILTLPLTLILNLTLYDKAIADKAIADKAAADKKAAADEAAAVKAAAFLSLFLNLTL